jgi:uncharacterized protein (TIGR02265 family)
VSDDSFIEPPWDAPLDIAAELKRIPDSSKQKGMFLIPMVVEAKRRGLTLPGARDRYLPFADYPLREHAQLLVECAQGFFPDQPIRHGLRRLGRAAHRVFIESTVGKVVWATVNDAHSALDAILKGYSISVPGCSLTMTERGPKSARLRLERVYYFLDCHHVGCIESAVRAVGVDAHVRIRLDTATSGEFLCEW